ncbi:polyhydroxyalkanoate depolymerase [Noviherbaspirillum sp. Root189]|uniref:polyhydroxyalkanoate depolymerase n=1 Tax=Noviherbaspirillum sp. Root189 TaxID=1736487 RepID=UPI00070DCE52|nr:polyhydroxyalkanoate depolymerase [Noviherbaspirillum sp. Root189]KRB87039.1 poly(3-hydroxybutyrate) depolymerase [Noviherbaspirillum sp. Root189]
MQYHVYQAQADFIKKVQLILQMTHASVTSPLLRQQQIVKQIGALSEIVSAARITHTRPNFGIDRISVNDGHGTRDVAVREVPALVLPFGTLLHFRKESVEAQPRVLIVAPLSGHFSTLMRETVRTMLADHDVYVSDWHNACNVPLASGGFDMEDYVDYLIRYLTLLGPGTHIVAVCQPCVAALCATAILAEDGNPVQPRTLTLMAGPIDTRINPTSVNELAVKRPLHWFEKNLISTVPCRYPGAMRRVYPGFLQLTAFLNMNLERHLMSFNELHRALLEEDSAKANTISRFYKEYFAVLDLSAEFYLETVRLVFQEHALPRGEMMWKGSRVDPAAIHHTALLTVEGERDDICGLGQTMAAHDLCRNIPTRLKLHHMQVGAGHYGVFSGRRWEQQIYPAVRSLIYSRQ